MKFCDFMHLFFYYLISSVLPPTTSVDVTKFVDNFKAFTIATNETDGFKQFLRSAKIYNIPLEVIGLGMEWKGGDMLRRGGGYKVNLLKEAVKPHVGNKSKIVMFTDGYDVLFLSGVSKIINKFLATNASILFSAEAWIWPDLNLRDEYPDVKNGYRFLNSGGFMGYADALSKLLNVQTLKDTDDDQLFYTKLYLNKTIRESLNIKLDVKADIFQNLFAATDDVRLVPAENTYELKNINYNTRPSVLHGNGISKYVEFRSMGNYLAKRWSLNEGCKECDEGVLKLENLPKNEYPKVVIAVFIAKPTPFLKEFLLDVFNQDYPKKSIYLFIHNAVPYHQNEVDNIVARFAKEYKNLIKVISSADEVDTVTARQLAMNYCLQKSCDAYLNVDSDAHLDLPDTLVSLIRSNRSIVAPMLTRPYKVWSNFWGALDSQGYYKRSFDYMEIVQYKRIGLWNVPYVSSCYLINGTILKNPELKPDYTYGNSDYDMNFCSDMRKKGIYLYIDNRQNFGHLTNLDGFDIMRTNPNLYELFNNKLDWEQAYLHPQYHKNFNPEKNILQPCPDVYWFPIVSARFCKEFIEIMENFGQWSDGSNQDKRLQGGYEAVPTRDIHMNQVGLNDHWLEFLKLYVKPLQELVFIGYIHDPPRSLMNFVVRYKPDEQPSLRPHHDSSTYTINIALNRPQVDYEGGGCRFLRYNCAVTNMKLGWMLMHPGRLTHFHEGLLVKNGTRYIMVSFVDP